MARYESRVGDNHHHVVCRSCGVIADVDCVVGEAPCLIPSDRQRFDGLSSTRPRSSTGACAPTALHNRLPDHSRDHSPSSPTPEEKVRRVWRARTRQSPHPNPRRISPLTNQDWWPNQVDISVLHANDNLSNPMGEDFDYAEEFKSSTSRR
mgnify:CR=1 FL=1